VETAVPLGGLLLGMTPGQISMVTELGPAAATGAAGAASYGEGQRPFDQSLDAATGGRR
jgi:hypothetical protein